MSFYNTFYSSLYFTEISVVVVFHIFNLSPTPVTPSTPTVQNVLINPSLIGSKNILITTKMVSQSSASESLKRKHEDDDDYDNL